jgi:hypothetical protein
MTRIKDTLSAVQSAAVTVAIVVGGIWTLFTFWGLGSINRSRAEQAVIQRDLAQADVVNVVVSATQNSAPDVAGPFVSGEVIIKNDGSVRTTIPFDNRSLRIARRLEDGSYEIVREAPLYAVGGPQTSWGLPPGSTARFSFFEPVPGPGVYLIQFVAETPNPNDGEATYGGRTIVVVR